MTFGALAAEGVTALYAAADLVRAAGQTAGWLLLPMLIAATSVAGGVVVGGLMLAAARAQPRRRMRRSWLLLGLGVACWTLGDLTRGALFLLTDGNPPSPSVADVGTLAGAALAFAGILLRPALGSRRGSRGIVLLDAASLMAALLALGWPFVFGPLFARSSLDAVGQLAVALPPVVGVGMLAVLVFGRAWHGGERRVAALLAGAVAAWTVAGAAVLAEVAQPAPAGWESIGRMLSLVALALLGTAAYGDWIAPAEQTRPLDEPIGSPLHFALPFLLLSVVTLIVAVAPPVGAVPVGRIAAAIAWALAVGRAVSAYGALIAAHRHERELRIGHAGSFRKEQQRRRQLEAVRDVTTELTHQLDLTTLLELITRRATNLVDASSGAVFLWDEAAQVLVPRAWHGLGTWMGGLRVRPGEGAAGSAAIERRGIILNDYPTSPLAHTALLAHTPISAALAAPIVYQDQLVGVIVAMHERPGRTFQSDDLDLLGLFADQAAMAIEQAHVFENVAMAEALRELARLKTEFLSTASHELRTPLTLIHGYAELLRMRATRLSAAEVADMAGEILNGSSTMIRLVDDLLDFARLESHQPIVEARRVDVELLLRRQLAALRERVGGERVVLEAPAPLDAEIDPSFLQQIVRNLVANALQYAPHGQVTVRAGRRDAWMVVEVADEGPGIPAREQSRIWETFYRGEHARVSPHRGSGLGLAVVKQLTELHGGRAEVESPPGRGATFRIWLPAAPRPGEQETPVVPRP